MVSFLKIFLSLVWLFMIYIIISTSLSSSLFEEWNFLASIPWMQATLWDFYGNVLLIYLWVLYRERGIPVRVLWATLFFCLGSIATIGYVLIQLFSLRPSEGIEAILQPKPMQA